MDGKLETRLLVNRLPRIRVTPRQRWPPVRRGGGGRVL